MSDHSPHGFFVLALQEQMDWRWQGWWRRLTKNGLVLSLAFLAGVIAQRPRR